jgi:hypothetical protein
MNAHSESAQCAVSTQSGGNRAAWRMKPPGAARVRSKLTLLQSNRRLAGRAPLAMKLADIATRTAETPEADARLAAERVRIADRQVDAAWAEAEVRLAEDQCAARETVRAYTLDPQEPFCRPLDAGW